MANPSIIDCFLCFNMGLSFYDRMTIASSLKCSGHVHFYSMYKRLGKPELIDLFIIDALLKENGAVGFEFASISDVPNL